MGFAVGRAFDGLAALAIGLAAILLILLAVWWIRGGRGWRIEEEVHVARSPEDVFAIVADPARFSELDPRIVGTEVLGNGRYRLHLRIGRRDVVAEAVEVAREPPSLLADDVMEVRIGGQRVEVGTQRQTVTVEPAGTGSLVRLRITGRGTSAASRLRIGTAHAREARAARTVLRRLRDYASAPAREP